MIVTPVGRRFDACGGWIPNLCMHREFLENGVHLALRQTVPLSDPDAQQDLPILGEQVGRQQEPERPGQHPIQDAANRGIARACDQPGHDDVGVDNERSRHRCRSARVSSTASASALDSVKPDRCLAVAMRAAPLSRVLTP